MDRRRVQQRGRLRRLASVWLSTGQFRTSCGYAWKGLLLGVDICAVGWLRRELLLVNERAPFEHFLCRELSSDRAARSQPRSEEHTSELQSRQYLVCRLLLEKKKKYTTYYYSPLVACLII